MAIFDIGVSTIKLYFINKCNQYNQYLKRKTAPEYTHYFS